MRHLFLPRLSDVAVRQHHDSSLGLPGHAGQLRCRLVHQGHGFPRRRVAAQGDHRRRSQRFSGRAGLVLDFRLAADLGCLAARLSPAGRRLVRPVYLSVHDRHGDHDRRRRAEILLAQATERADHGWHAPLCAPSELPGRDDGLWKPGHDGLALAPGAGAGLGLAGLVRRQHGHEGSQHVPLSRLAGIPGKNMVGFSGNLNSVFNIGHRGGLPAAGFCFRCQHGAVGHFRWLGGAHQSLTRNMPGP